MHDTLNDAFDDHAAACTVLRQARAAFKRSKTAKNLAAFHAAEAASEAAAQACHVIQAAIEAADKAEAAAAKKAARAAKTSLQLTLFA